MLLASGFRLLISPSSSSPSSAMEACSVPFSMVRRLPGNKVLGGRISPRLSRAAAPTRIAAVDGVATDLPPVEITWQIAVGALAGVTPFIVAGIEFGKRIVAQKKCGACGGSGLVLKNDYYVRCPGCGGFLPWQSWKKFFSG